MKMQQIDPVYFQQEDVVSLARQMLGWVVQTRIDGVAVSGRIVETEAYAGITDRASHAWGGRRTARTEVMYLPGGHAYIYLCYGLHNMFNIVTGPQDVPHAVLIRAIEPLAGIETMMQRRRKSNADYSLTKGPGCVGEALGLQTSHSGLPLDGQEISVWDDGYRKSATGIIITPRIGVDYAGDDAALPYRFFMRESPWVSGRGSKQTMKTRTAQSKPGNTLQQHEQEA